MIKQGPTLVLKAVSLSFGLGVFVLCSFFLPMGIASDQVGYYRPLLIGMYLPAIPFFFGLFQALKLLNLIDKGKAFSISSVKTLKNIKYSAFIISLLYMLGLPYIFYVADRDDAPGVMLIGMILVFASFVIGVFASVLQKLIQNALNLKEENDLTV